MRLEKLGEDNLIRSLSADFGTKHARLLKGIGDDASVSLQKGGKALLVTTDILVEGTHFKRGCVPPYLLGRKALSISLSDVAAMGGVPLLFFVSLALTPSTSKKFIDELYRGLGDVARRYGCALAGGNTARAGSGMTVSTTVVGEAPPEKVVYRKGAASGDLVFITGEVGGSALGLRTLLKHEGRPPGRLPWKESVRRHLDPAPRLEAGLALARGALATAMMDISDGVALDLRRLCVESGKSAVINLSALPISDELWAYGERTGKSPLLHFALTGGEDYELLFTSPESNLKKISALSRKLGLPMTPVGRIRGRRRDGQVVTVLGEDGEPLELKRLGFEHF